MAPKKAPTPPDLGGDYLTGYDDGAVAPAPPKVWAERPDDWPRKVPFNGILPDREKYPDARTDPAFAHLLRPSVNPKRPGVVCFPPGRSPINWHPAYRPQSVTKNLGKVHEHTARQKETPANDPTEGGDPEERTDSFRALSRVYASLPEAKLRKIIEKLASQAAAGDSQAQSLFVRLETLQASRPVDNAERGAIKPEAVRSAEQALAALVAKVGAVYPNGACPWCGHEEPE